MRPRTFDEVVGQAHLVGPGKFLAELGIALPSSAPSDSSQPVRSGHTALPSMILYGPPGTGKTTLARLLAERARATFISLSAVSCGVKDVRAVVADARSRLVERGARTILFLDEIHRFSKAQQDALLPHVEAGTVILIGATTENPSFEVNAALLSRARVVRLEALDGNDLAELIERALSDSERGLGSASLKIVDSAKDALIAGGSGDARRILGALEVAASLCKGDVIDDALIEQALGQKTLLYDKAGEQHYGVVSAFIKSMRGSDPDAALYWMTRMLEAGEDPMFVVRRIVIFASEDVGLADPNALSVATAAASAFRLVGLPEGVLPLTQAVLYLACAPKSNSVLSSYANTRKAVRESGSLPVPAKLRNATSSLGKALGHGRGYKYPHNLGGHYVADDYLPEALVGERFYEPSSSGSEAAVAIELESRRQKEVGDGQPEPLADSASGSSGHPSDRHPHRA